MVSKDDNGLIWKFTGSTRIPGDDEYDPPELQFYRSRPFFVPGTRGTRIFALRGIASRRCPRGPLSGRRLVSPALIDSTRCGRTCSSLPCQPLPCRWLLTAFA